MRCNCGPLIKAIDAYIAKADDDLADALADAGFIDPDGTPAEINTLEEKVAAALTAETDYLPLPKTCLTSFGRSLRAI